MAGRAIGAILAVMRVLLFMAGIAVAGRALEYLVDMAGFTGNFLVLAFELEGRQVVIEPGRCPAVLGVTVCTAHAEAPSMRIILLVTCGTILKRDRKVT